MNIKAAIAIGLIMFAAGLSADDNHNTAAIDAEIFRILTALDFGTEAKASFDAAAADQDPEVAKVLRSIPAHRFVEMAVPSFRKLATLDEAKALADFYMSDPMQAMLKEQASTGSYAPVARTPAQAAAVKEFMDSNLGQVARRIQQALQTEQFSQSFETRLMQEIETTLLKE